MLKRIELFCSDKKIRAIEIPEQCRIVCYGGKIYEPHESDPFCFASVDHLFFDGIDPDTICVVRNLDHEREAA